MDVIDRISEIIAENGVPMEKAMDISERIRREFVGEQIYIPNISGNRKKEMENELMRTKNHKKVAKEYGVSLSTTYRIRQRLRKKRK